MSTLVKFLLVVLVAVIGGFLSIPLANGLKQVVPIPVNGAPVEENVDLADVQEEVEVVEDGSYPSVCSEVSRRAMGYGSIVGKFKNDPAGRVCCREIPYPVGGSFCLIKLWGQDAKAVIIPSSHHQGAQ